MFSFIDLNHLFLPSPIANVLWLLKHSDEVKLVHKNIKLKEAYSGKRCFIVANGPSLSRENLALLKNEIVFTCNLFPNSELFKKIDPTFHVVTDPLFYNSDTTSINNVISNLHKKGVRILFFNSSAKNFIDSNHIDGFFDVYYVSQFFLKGLNTQINLASCIPAFPTVTQVEICIALYLGFSKIYLLGCDCTGFVSLASTRQKSFSKESNLKNAYAFNLNETDKKLVNKNLSTRPIEDELRGYATIFENYIKLNSYCKKHNISLVNLSSGGVLTYLPEDKLDSVI